MTFGRAADSMEDEVVWTASAGSSIGELVALAVAPLVLGALTWVTWMMRSGRWRGWFYQSPDVPLGKLNFGYRGTWPLMFFVCSAFTLMSIGLLLGYVGNEVVPRSGLAQALWRYAGMPALMIGGLMLAFMVFAFFNALDVHRKVFKRGRFPWAVRLLAPAWFKDEVLRQVAEMPDRHTPPPDLRPPSEWDEDGDPAGGPPSAPSSEGQRSQWDPPDAPRETG